MFELEVAWTELVLRGVVVYAALFIMLRLTGRRTVGQATPFDLLVVMLLSEAANGSMTGGDTSLVGGLLVCAVLMALNFVAAFLTSRSKVFEALLEGEAVLVGRNGRIYNEVLARHHVSRADMQRALREADCRLEQLECAFLEADGQITVQKRQAPEAGPDEPRGQRA